MRDPEGFILEYEGPWQVARAAEASARPTVSELLAWPVAAVLRDDRRSRVVRLVPRTPGDGCPPAGWVLKIPRWQDGRAWNRLSTLWREGEARRAFRRALRLAPLAIPAPRPVMQWQRRRAGLVVESGWLYTYEEGVRAGLGEGPGIIALLVRLHGAGLAHGDPHLANWLRRGSSVIALDCAPRRSLLPALAAAYDFVLLRNCEPALLPLLPGRRSLWWRLALARDAWVHGLRRFKRALRGGRVRPMA
jgi:hypothetical protein